MPRKQSKPSNQIEYFINDEPSSLLEIVENNPDDAIWKEYLEKNNLQDSDSARRYLRQKIGDYLSAKEISKRTGINIKTHDKWRNKDNKCEIRISAR